MKMIVKNRCLLAVRSMIATAVGGCVLILSFLAVWRMSSEMLMANTVLDFWTRASLRSVNELIMDRIDRGGSPPQSLREISAELRDINFPNSSLKIVKNGIPVDGWGRPLLYSVHETSYTLQSYGRDGLPGGTGLDRDLDSNADNPSNYSDPYLSNPPVPTLHQFVYELPSGGMLWSCALSGMIAFVLSIYVIRSVPNSKAHALGFVIRIGVTVVITILFAIIIMQLHVPSGH